VSLLFLQEPSRERVVNAISVILILTFFIDFFIKVYGNQMYITPKIISCKAYICDLDQYTKTGNKSFPFAIKKAPIIMNGAFNRLQSNAILEIVLLLSHQD